MLLLLLLLLLWRQQPPASGTGNPNQAEAFVHNILGEYVTWTFSPNNNGIAHQGRAG
jgi:hypothetical protein